jgi:hypothetical protein
MCKVINQINFAEKSQQSEKERLLKEQNATHCAENIKKNA